NALAQGQTLDDTFTYSIRLGNGTLSWATATVRYSGVNDGPTANADTNGTDTVKEAGGQPDGNVAEPADNAASGNVLTNDTDPDKNAQLSVAAVNGNASNVNVSVAGTYGSVVIHTNGTWTYTLDNADADTQRLAQGASANEVFQYTVTDEFGATS